LLRGIRRLVGEGNADPLPELERTLCEEDNPEGTEQIMALADALGALYRLGAAEREACLKVLLAFGALADSRPRRGE
jgi:hypothetical protein